MSDEQQVEWLNRDFALVALHSDDPINNLLTLLNEKTQLNLSWSNITLKECQIVAAAIKDPNNKLTRLDMGNNKLGLQGGKVIAEAIMHPNNKLTDLDMGGNNLGDEAGKAIAEALMHPNNKLTRLNMSHTFFRAFPIAVAMLPSLRLKTLKLHGNESIVFPPRNIVEYDYEGTKVLKYFADLRAKGGVPLDPISVLLVGRGGSGKSTLVHRAVKRQQSLPNDVTKFSRGDVLYWARSVGLPLMVVKALEAEKIAGVSLLNWNRLDETLKINGIRQGDRDSVGPEINRLCQRCEEAQHAHRNPYLSTVGIHTTGHETRKGVRLRLVDFAGQPEYYVTHSLFLNQVSALYVVVVPYCLPSTQLDPTASNQSHLHSSDPIAIQHDTISSISYMHNEAYHAEIERLLKSLCSNLPQGAHVPIVIALTHLDVTPDHVPYPDTASLSKHFADRFNLTLDIKACIAVDYRQPKSVELLGDTITGLAEQLSAQTVIPRPYAACTEAIRQHTKQQDKTKRSCLIKRVEFDILISDVLRGFSKDTSSSFALLPSSRMQRDAIAASAAATAESEALRGRVVEFLSSTFAIYSDPRLDMVVLEPREWLSHTLAAFVAQNRAKPLKQTSGCFLSQDLVAHRHQLGCKDESELLVVMQLLMRLELCYPVDQPPSSKASGDEEDARNLLARSYSLHSQQILEQLPYGFLFPGLLPPSQGFSEEIKNYKAQMMNDELLAFAVSCPISTSILSPAFFPILQQRLYRTFGAFCTLRKGVASVRLKSSAWTAHLALLLRPDLQSLWVLLKQPRGVDSRPLTSLLEALLEVVSRTAALYKAPVELHQLCPRCVQDDNLTPSEVTLGAVTALSNRKEGWSCDKEHKALPQFQPQVVVKEVTSEAVVAAVMTLVDDRIDRHDDVMRQRLLDVAAGHDLLRNLIAQLQPNIVMSRSS